MIQSSAGKSKQSDNPDYEKIRIIFIALNEL
jgi:hypothetical protein